MEPGLTAGQSPAADLVSFPYAALARCDWKKPVEPVDFANGLREGSAGRVVRHSFRVSRAGVRFAMSFDSEFAGDPLPHPQ
jgi:hypothetical protein